MVSGDALVLAVAARSSRYSVSWSTAILPCGVWWM